MPGIRPTEAAREHAHAAQSQLVRQEGPGLFRNLMAMDADECIRAYPLDGVVLLSGCDKTTPAMLMGAASADVPAIMVTGGPMLKGVWCNQELGSGTDARKIWAQRRAGEITDEVMAEVEGCLSRSSGHCMVMGTAS